MDAEQTLWSGVQAFESPWSGDASHFNPFHVAFYISADLGGDWFTLQFWMQHGELIGCIPGGPEWCLAWEGPFYSPTGAAQVFIEYDGADVNSVFYIERMVADTNEWVPPTAGSGLRFVAVKTIPGGDLGEGNIVYDTSRNRAFVANNDWTEGGEIGDGRLWYADGPTFHPWTECLPGAARLFTEAGYFYPVARCQMIGMSLMAIASKSLIGGGEDHLVMRYSEDGGATWSAEAILTSNIDGDVYALGPPFHHSSGRVIIPAGFVIQDFLFCDGDWRDPGNWLTYDASGDSAYGRRLAELTNANLYVLNRSGAAAFDRISQYSVSAEAPYFTVVKTYVQADDEHFRVRPYAPSIPDNTLLFPAFGKIFMIGPSTHCPAGRRLIHSVQTVSKTGAPEGWYSRSPTWFGREDQSEHPSACAAGRDLLVHSCFRYYLYVQVIRDFFAPVAEVADDILAAIAAAHATTDELIVECKDLLEDIAVTGAAINRLAESVEVEVDGGTPDGTVEDTETLNDQYFSVVPEAGKIDFYFDFDIGAHGVPVNVTWNGRLDKPAPAAETIDVYAWHWDAEHEDFLGTIAGVKSSTPADDSARTFTLFLVHVNDEGKVRIRFTKTGMDAADTFYTDQIFVSAAIVLSPQDMRDAMKLAPTAGAPAAGSVDAELDTIAGQVDVKTSEAATAIISAVGTREAAGAAATAAGQIRGGTRTLESLATPDNIPTPEANAAKAEEVLAAAHGEGSWEGIAESDWSVAERKQIRDALGVDGTKVAAAGGQVQAIKAKTDLITAGSVRVRTPVAQDGTITLMRGDSYLEEDGTALSLDIPNYVGPDLTAEGTVLSFSVGPRREGQPAIFTIEAAAEMDGTTLVLSADVASKNTALLDAPGEYLYDFQAVLASGGIFTPAAGKLLVLADVTAEPEPE
ncbi:MAG TPA: sialidase family protein [Phycisphaerae bacterium]|nr:sialidase family protein [Phycisphaerae bacterium]